MAQSLPLPAVPDTLKTPQDRAAFIATHYWDGMDWNDEKLLKSEEFMGESMATYGTLLTIPSLEQSQAIVTDFLEGISNESKAVNTLADFAYSYYYYPDSPYYNEDLYRIFVNALSGCHALSEINKEKLKLYSGYLSKNRIGDIAANFSFVDNAGNTRELASSAPEATLKLLVLYDPDCHECEEAINLIKDSERFNEEIKNGKACVIAINAFGQDNGGAAIPKKNMSADWIIGYSPDGQIDEEEIYVIRKTPAIYLLDSENRILRKDLSLENLNHFMNEGVEISE